MDLDLFYGKVNFGHMLFIQSGENVNIGFFRQFVASDLKVCRYTQIIE